MSNEGHELDASFAAKLSVSLDTIADQQRETNRRLAELRSTVPVDIRPWGAGSVAAGNLGITLNVGQRSGPDLGFVWLVHRIVVGGSTWGTAATGTAEVYCTPMDASQAATVRPIQELADQAASLPSVAGYSNRQLVVQPNEQLVVVVVSPTANQLYVAAAQVEQYPIAAYRDAFVL